MDLQESLTIINFRLEELERLRRPLLEVAGAIRAAMEHEQFLRTAPAQLEAAKKARDETVSAYSDEIRGAREERDRRVNDYQLETVAARSELESAILELAATESQLEAKTAEIDLALETRRDEMASELRVAKSVAAKKKSELEAEINDMKIERGALALEIAGLREQGKQMSDGLLAALKGG